VVGNVPLGERSPEELRVAWRLASLKGLSSRLRFQAQITPSRPPEYLWSISNRFNLAGHPRASLQDGIVRVHGQAIDAESVSAGGVRKRQYEANSLLFLSNHAHVWRFCGGRWRFVTFGAHQVALSAYVKPSVGG